MCRHPHFSRSCTTETLFSFRGQLVSIRGSNASRFPEVFFTRVDKNKRRSRFNIAATRARLSGEFYRNYDASPRAAYMHVAKDGKCGVVNLAGPIVFARKSALHGR